MIKHGHFINLKKRIEIARYEKLVVLCYESQ